MKISKYLCALAIAGACSTSLSAATLSFNLVETGVNTVNLTVNGSISSLAGWTFVTSFQTQQSYIQPDRGAIISFGGGLADLYAKATVAPYSIGSSSSNFGGIRLSGDTVGFQAKQGGDSYLFLPKGYSAGTPINSSTVYDNENLSSLGLTSGTSYSWAAGPDIIQINVGPASGGGTSAVPEASTSLGLLGLAAGGILTRRRSKRAA